MGSVIRRKATPALGADVSVNGQAGHYVVGGGEGGIGCDGGIYKDVGRRLQGIRARIYLASQ